MKTVFSDIRQVCHIWAQRSQQRGKAGNVFFEGNTIYSYGRHYPMAHWMTTPGGTLWVAMNSNPYSSSTNRHRHYVRQSLRQSVRIIEIGDMRGSDPSLNDMAIQNVVDDLRKQFASKVREAQTDRRIAASTRLGLYSAAHKIAADFHWVCESYGIETYPLEPAIDPDIIKNLEEQAQASNERRRELEAQRRARQMEVDRDKFERWRAGESLRCPQSFAPAHGFDLMAYSSTADHVTTSRGAAVPGENVRKAWPLIKHLRNTGGRLGEPIGIPPFTIHSFDGSTGELVAGCHRFEWSEIERLAKQMNLI